MTDKWGVHTNSTEREREQQIEKERESVAPYFDGKGVVASVGAWCVHVCACAQNRRREREKDREKEGHTERENARR